MPLASEESPSLSHREPSPVTIAERVYAELREAIVEGRILAGSKISEPELSRTHGISRASLRDALGRLEASGLVVRKPNVGARVVGLSSEGLLEIYAVREALEAMSARLATENMTDEQIEGLRDLLNDHDAQIASRKGAVYFQKEGDADFHYRIVLGTGNGRLIGLLGTDLYYIMRMYRYQFGMQSKRVPKAFVEHEQIVDAMGRRDAEQAESLMRYHIRASRLNVEKMLAEREGDALS